MCMPFWSFLLFWSTTCAVSSRSVALQDVFQLTALGQKTPWVVTCHCADWTFGVQMQVRGANTERAREPWGKTTNREKQSIGRIGCIGTQSQPQKNPKVIKSLEVCNRQSIVRVEYQADHASTLPKIQPNQCRLKPELDVQILRGRSIPIGIPKHYPQISVLSREACP